MAHPVRGQVLTQLSGYGAQSAAEIAVRTSVPIRSVRHHLGRLEAAGLIGVASSREIRGAAQKFYEVRVIPSLGTADVEALSPEVARRITAENFRTMVADVDRAFTVGAIDWSDWSDCCEARIGAEVDEEGWSAIARLMLSAFEDVDAAAKRAAIRLERTSEPPRLGIFGLLWFERPGRDDPDWTHPDSRLLPGRRLLTAEDRPGGDARRASTEGLAAAMGHPVQSKILYALSDTHPLSAGQIAGQIAESTRRVHYYLARLVQSGLLEEVRAPGPHRKRYTLSVPPILWPDDLAALGPEDSRQIAIEIFRRILVDVAGAISAGTFYRRSDFVQVKLPALVDREGWSEIHSISARTLEEVESVHAAATARLSEGQEKLIVATAAILWLDLPAP